MKTLTEYITEQITNESSNRFKNFLRKAKHPLKSKEIHDLPFIRFENGKYWFDDAAQFSTELNWSWEYDNKKEVSQNWNKVEREYFDVIDRIMIKCADTLERKYKSKITSEKIELDRKLLSKDDGITYELADCTDEEAANIYTEIVDMFIDEVKKSKLKYLNIDHDNSYTNYYKDNAYIDSYSIECEPVKTIYLYPTITLGTGSSIIQH